MPTRARAVAQVLALAEDRFGLGYGATAPRWVRDRVLTVLERVAARRNVGLLGAVDELARDRGAFEELLSALRVGETRFYRDRSQWEVLAREIVPSLPPGEISALSAGCSTGEEAWTLAMLFTLMRRRCRVLGVDRSAPAVSAAREGVYDAETARDLPPAWTTRFLAPAGGALRIADELRGLVAFEECDLVQRTPRGPFHVILFKNVLLYLAAPAGEAVATRLAAELDPNGVLFASASEVLRLRTAGLVSIRIAPGITAFR